MITGAAGLAFAADKVDPLHMLAMAVDQVKENTLAIADQTGLIAKETSTVIQQNTTIANRTAALASATKQLDLKLDAVMNAIAKIESAPPAPPVAAPPLAHTTWLAPYVHDFAASNRFVQATTYVLNTGVEPAKVTCNYFNDEGARLDHHQVALALEPGAIGTCEPMSVTPMVNIGWHLIVSDRPVIVTGKNERRDPSTGMQVTSENMVLRAVDCSGDQAGIELVCDAVAAIGHGK